ncbi:MAG: GYD domain-containing protein [Candidatus Eisenbacteria bacterium]|nr:GYD domain-containing protein [Candidatus Eisenbacteria bacterium]
MPTFVLMTKLAPEVSREVRHREELGQQWKAAVEEKCPDVRWISHFALLGPYDFMDIFEAKSEESAAKVSMISRARGAVTAESWTAIPYARFLDINEEIA